ncbi:MAG: hypothetical protein HXX14_04930 [Bacteroidetes bacterium]|nr:hypothetical protein [Bacteroidota bacterium]
MEKNKTTPDQLINWSSLSRFLSGNRNNIKKTIPFPSKHKRHIEELEDLIAKWMEKFKAT